MCQAPGCYDDAKYAEPTDHSDEPLTVCHRHVDPTKDGIEKL